MSNPYRRSNFTGFEQKVMPVQHLFKEICPTAQLDSHVEKVLSQLATNFVATALHSSNKLAKHRNDENIEVEDVALFLDMHCQFDIFSLSNEYYFTDVPENSDIGNPETGKTEFTEVSNLNNTSKVTRSSKCKKVSQPKKILVKSKKASQPQTVPSKSKELSEPRKVLSKSKKASKRKNISEFTKLNKYKKILEPLKIVYKSQEVSEPQKVLSKFKEVTEPQKVLDKKVSGLKNVLSKQVSELKESKKLLKTAEISEPQTSLSKSKEVSEPKSMPQFKKSSKSKKTSVSQNVSNPQNVSESKKILNEVNESKKMKLEDADPSPRKRRHVKKRVCSCPGCK